MRPNGPSIRKALSHTHGTEKQTQHHLLHRTKMVNVTKAATLFFLLVLISNNVTTFVLAFNFHCKSSNFCSFAYSGCTKKSGSDHHDFCQVRRRSTSTSSSALSAGRFTHEFRSLEAMTCSRTSKTTLFMGMFDFFQKNKSNQKNDKDDDDELGQQRPADIGSGGYKSSNDDDGGGATNNPTAVSYSSSPSPSALQRETIQQRTQRLKTGGYTLEEKEKFLETALERLKPKTNKNTTKIRQSLPLASSQKQKTLDENASTSSSSSNSKISPELSWSTVVSRKRMDSIRSNNNNSNMDEGKSPIKIDLNGDEAAKQAWLNMVTSPTRFQSYTAVQKQTQITITNDVVPQVDDAMFENLKQQKQLQDLSDAKKRLQEQQKVFELMASKSGESLLNASPFLPRATHNNTNKRNPDAVAEDGASIKSSSNVVSEEGRNDLGSRLEQAAVLQEQQEAESRRNDLASRLEQAAVLQEKQEAESRKALAKQREENQKLADLARKQETEFRRMEDERLAKKREEEAQRFALKEEKRKIEEAKLKELEALQDAYWKQKLAQEKAFRESRMAPKEESRLAPKEESRLAPKEVIGKVKPEEPQDTTEILKRKIRSMQLNNEMSLLKLSEVHQKEAKDMARDIIDSTAKSVAAGESRSSKPSSFGQTFNIEEQNAKMNALKKLQAEQQEQLKTLSSLPDNAIRSGVHPLLNSPPLPSSSSSSPKNIKPQDDDEEQEPLNSCVVYSADKPTITVGDILSGKVDPESVDVDEILVKRAAEKEQYTQKPIQQQSVLEQKNPIQQQSVLEQKKPIRQKLTFDNTDLGSAPPLRPMSSNDPLSTIEKKKPGWKISEEDRQKANKWGINIDKLT